MADDTYSRGHRSPPDRGGAGADGPAVNPLTELARLIGQSDPFAAVEPRRPDARPAEPTRQPTDWHGQPLHPDRGRDRGHQGYDNRAQDAHYGADRRDFPPEYDRQAPAEQGYYDDPHEAYPEQPHDADRAGGPHDDMDGYAADPHDEHPDDRFYDDEAPQPR